MERPLVVLLAALLIVAPFQGCLSDDSSSGEPDGQDGSDGDDGDDGDDGTGDDGDDQEPLPPIPDLRFNGTLAREHVADQIRWENGSDRYRVPGTDGSDAARRDIFTTLEDHGWNPSVQRWQDTYVCEETPLTNIVGTMPGQTDRQIILGAHYDTRPWAEQDHNFSRRGEPTLGANDGGSGVGALLELARVLPEQRPLNHSIKLVFFDAEDGGSPPPIWSDCNPDEHEGHHTPDGWVIGSTHYVTEMGEGERDRTEAVIILDLVGDVNLTLLKERHSHLNAQDLQDRIWGHAEALNHTQFRDKVGSRVLDDHRPFQRVGIPAVDIIHLDEEGSTPFPSTWHTHNDTLENVSAESLQVVGEVTERTIYDLDRELGRSG